jgi:hypothetical protein
MNEIYVKDISVNRLFDWFDQRCLAVPEIQREFVWNAKRAVALLDSMYKGYPIGTVMVWRADKKQAWMLRHKLHILPAFDATQNKEILFLVDGQQRLSVLHQVRRGETIPNSNGREIRFGDIYFSVNGDEEQFQYLKRPDPEQHFSVSRVLSDHWRKSFRGLFKYQLEAIKQCRERLLKYRIFMVFYDTKELTNIRETFIRINAQGMRISEADKAFSQAQRVKPLHRYHQLCETLPFGYKALDKAVYWTTLVLVRGYKYLGQKAFTRFTKEIDRKEEGRLWFERQEPKVAESIKLASDYLVNTLGVDDFKLLPYENMIAMLAAFFYANNRSQPSGTQREQIRRWFWFTAVVQRYAGAGYESNIIADRDFFMYLGKTRKGKYQITERISLQSLKQANYQAGSALSKSFKLLLRHNKPRYVTNGEPMPLGAVAAATNKRDLHHIFPKSPLKNAGLPRKQFNTICNICLAVAHDNRSFGKKLPCRYLEEFRRTKVFARVMKANLIPYAEKSPLWDTKATRGFKAFTEARLKLIKKAFTLAAGGKLFE